MARYSNNIRDLQSNFEYLVGYVEQLEEELEAALDRGHELDEKLADAYADVERLEGEISALERENNP
jgi:predicted  nucleic acid-binding Zn-ribbon protein